MTRNHYFTELESVRQNLVGMGERTVSLFDEALRTAVEPNPEALAKASELEAQTDHQHRKIHDQCLNLITPVARDARLITGVLDAIVDLELIGDYAYEIATLSSALRRRPPSQILAQIAEAAARVKVVLTGAIDAWRGGGGAVVPDARSLELSIRSNCSAVYEKLSQLTTAPGDATVYVDLMLISRHLERILRHAVFVADQSAGAADPINRFEQLLAETGGGS